MKKNSKAVKILLAIRAVLWIAAATATIYWIYWSFELYKLGYHDEHEYAVAFRPYFRVGLWSSVACLFVSSILRRISDHIRGYKGE